MKKAFMTLCFAMVAAAAFALVPATDQYIPALGHAYGAPVKGVAPWWRGDVWIFNPSSSQTATVTIFLLLRQSNPTPESRQVTVAPGDTTYLPDVIYGTFGYDNLYAGLRLLSDIPVVATAEAYDANVTTVVNQTQGTAGAFFSGLPANFALGQGESSDLPGFDQDGTGTSGLFRSNLAVVETTGNPVTYSLQIFDGSGNLIGAKAYSLGGREVGQINTVITDVTGGTGTNDRIHVVVTGGTGRLSAVGSRIDNRTGDPSTIDMVGIHQSGRFEGIVLDVATGTVVDGGLQVVVGGGAVTDFQGVAGIPCGSDSFTLDFSPSSGINVPIAGDGTFTTSISIQYTDGTNNLFTTNWTLAGARGADGTWSGTLKSDTTGGATVGGYNYSTCNALGITRQWRAAWTGGNS